MLGPLLFLIYIYDITNNIQSNCLLYADDTSLFVTVKTPEISAVKLNKDLEQIYNWADTWLMNIDPAKTKCLTFSVKCRPQHPTLFYNCCPVDEVDCHTHLGIMLFSNLSWRAHILNIYQKVSKILNVLKGIRLKVHRSTLHKLFKSLIRPIMEYADVLWDGCSDSVSNPTEFVQ